MTTVRLFRDQLQALDRVALSLRYAEGGRVDRSGLLRDLLDRLAGGDKIPEAVRNALQETRREARR
jgi:hypothetical protein